MKHAQSALATLPLSFHDPGEVAVVNGTSGWPAEVLSALESGAHGVVLVHPQPAEFADLLAADRSTVVVDSPWASNPAISSAAQALVAADGSRLECRVTAVPGSDFATALLHQLMLIRALLSPVSQVRIHYRSGHTLYAEGSTETGVTVDFSLICTNAVPPSAAVRLLTSDGSVELLIPDGATAQPAQLTTVGPDGAVLAPTYYETGHRAALRRLRDTAPADRLTDLRHLHDDVLVTTAALEGAQS